MKLYLLRPRRDNKVSFSPREPWYDKCFGFVVRAENEDRARALAAEEAADEGKEAWLDDAYSACVELLAEGSEEIVIADVRQA